jgi:hypothetical protein
MKAAGVAGAGIAVAAAIGSAAYFILGPQPEPPAASKPVEAAKGAPSLYCQFYVFVEQRPRLAFLFDVGRRDGRPVFSQLYIAEDNGARTDYDGKTEPRPEWSYDPAVDPRTISSKIMVPDTSQAGQHEQDILIQLYGYEPARDSKSFFEASLKNIHYQNLPGKCRQSTE